MILGAGHIFFWHEVIAKPPTLPRMWAPDVHFSRVATLARIILRRGFAIIALPLNISAIIFSSSF